LRWKGIFDFEDVGLCVIIVYLCAYGLVMLGYLYYWFGDGLSVGCKRFAIWFVGFYD